MILQIPVAWLQLAKQKVRFLVAVAGIAFIVILMFMQYGFSDALYDSATGLHSHLRGDLFLISTQYKALTSTQSFPRVRLYQALGFDGVETVNPVYLSFAKFKNTETGQKYPLYVIGFDPGSPVLDLPEVNQNLDVIKFPDMVLFDSASRPEFGPIAEEFHKGKPASVEIFSFNGTVGYRVKVGGTFKLGVSFGVDGNLVASYSTLLRTIPDREADKIDIGLITLKPGADIQKVLANLIANLPKDVKVLTRQEYVKFEKDYWAIRTPIGFVFNLMAVMGFVVGVVVVYQILYSNISSHLAEYATLKAMGFKNHYFLKVVFQQAVFLALLGYVPGFAITLWLYDLASANTHLPVAMNFGKFLTVFSSTLLMCLLSGFFSIGKLQAADPSDVF